MMICEQSDGWLVTFDGCAITRCCVDTGFTLLMTEASASLELRIEGELSLSGSTGSLSLTAGHALDAIPILELIQVNVCSISMAKAGELQLLLANDRVLRIDWSENYEAWEISADNGLKIVCLPGGGLSVWLANVRRVE